MRNSWNQEVWLRDQAYAGSAPTVRCRQTTWRGEQDAGSSVKRIFVACHPYVSLITAHGSAICQMQEDSVCIRELEADVRTCIGIRARDGPHDGAEASLRCRDGPRVAAISTGRRRICIESMLADGNFGSPILCEGATCFLGLFSTPFELLCSAWQGCISNTFDP